MPRSPSRSAAETLDAAVVREALQTYLDDLGSAHMPSTALKELIGVVQGGGSRKRKSAKRGRPNGPGARMLTSGAPVEAQPQLRSQTPLPMAAERTSPLPPPPQLHRSLPAFAVLSTPSGDRALLVQCARTVGLQQQQFWFTARGWEAAAGSTTGSVDTELRRGGQEAFLAAAGATTTREGKQKLRYFSFGEAVPQASRKEQHALFVEVSGRTDVGPAQLVRHGGAGVFGQETVDRTRTHAGAAAAFYRAYGMDAAAAPATTSACSATLNGRRRLRSTCWRCLCGASSPPPSRTQTWHSRLP